MRCLLVCCLVLLVQGGFSQETLTERFRLRDVPEVVEEMPVEFHVSNRVQLRELLPDSAVVALFAAPVHTRSNDINYRYHQDPDFLYFSGLDKPNSLLLIFSEPVKANGQYVDEILFVDQHDGASIQWTSDRYTLDEARGMSGVQMTLPSSEMKNLDLKWELIVHAFTNALPQAQNDNPTAAGDLPSMLKHWNAMLDRNQITASTDEGEAIFAQLRQIKSLQEIALVRQAALITCQAQKSLMSSCRPAMSEAEAEAIINYTFRASGAAGEAFPSIVAAGRNGAIMHYTENADVMLPGDMVVVDIGAEYEHYTADITRTFPVDRKFTEAQKAVYQVVLNAQNAALEACVKGQKFWAPHDAAYREIGKGLIKLGIITEWSEIGEYFIHGTSHYLGMDVHDAGLYGALQPGQIITVEPGVYIPEGSKCDEQWWNIFVRIEDDVLITEEGYEVLSDCVPRDIIEIEALRSKAPFD